MNSTESQVQEIITRETAKKQFAEYFNLEEGWFIDDTFANGEIEEKDGGKAYFEIKMYEEYYIYNIDISPKFKYYYTPDVEGANKYLGDCLHQGIGFHYELLTNDPFVDPTEIRSKINPHIKFSSDVHNKF